MELTSADTTARSQLIAALAGSRSMAASLLASGPRRAGAGRTDPRLTGAGMQRADRHDRKHAARRRHAAPSWAGRRASISGSGHHRGLARGVLRALRAGRVTDRFSADAKPRRGGGRRHEPAHVRGDPAGAVTAPGRRGAVGPAEARRSRSQPSSGRRALPAKLEVCSRRAGEDARRGQDSDRRARELTSRLN
jgi:hypothetical protein